MELLKKIALGTIDRNGKDREVTKIYDGTQRQIIEVILRNCEILPKHKAREPITVLCLAGKGRFLSGENLEEQIELSAGDLLTLDGGIEHEVIAEPELKILVTKFKPK